MALKLPIYLDHHATTPVDPRVFEAMVPFLTEHFGNPSSKTHAFGWRAEEVVTLAREQVARLIHAEAREVIWTSGTTESNNWALRGVAMAHQKRGNHIITAATEHRSVLEVVRALENLGFQPTVLPVDGNGIVDPGQVRQAITGKTILISIMAANHEIGTIHPVAAIGEIAKEKGVLFHVDAAQACGKIPVDVEAMGIDLLSMSAHKVYGPKGVGALWIRAREPHVRIEPLFYGGGQERGLRPGTLAVPAIVGMGRAFEIAGMEMESESKRLVLLREHLRKGLMDRIPNVILNGHPTDRLPGNLNLSFLGRRSDALIPKIRDVAVSSGSACASSETAKPSYVIEALGGPSERALSSLRFGLGRSTTEEEIDFAIERVVEAVRAPS
ncbi:MAG TPA: aminotransferase class V-fold PLP-dependent enzyme [bacterium]|nr:aminotransferase class V-fold PLP-dependent enzyme [bacterium]